MDPAASRIARIRPKEDILHVITMNFHLGPPNVISGVILITCHDAHALPTSYDDQDPTFHQVQLSAPQRLRGRYDRRDTEITDN